MAASKKQLIALAKGRKKLAAMRKAGKKPAKKNPVKKAAKKTVKKTVKRKTNPHKTVAKKKMVKRAARKPTKKTVKKDGFTMSMVNGSGNNVGYWTGKEWDDSSMSARWYPTVAALKGALKSAKAAQKRLAGNASRYGIAANTRKK